MQGLYTTYYTLLYDHGICSGLRLESRMQADTNAFAAQMSDQNFPLIMSNNRQARAVQLALGTKELQQLPSVYHA